MSTTTTRLALTQPAGSDAPSLLRTSIGGNATTLDNSVLVTEGTLAGRPGAATVEHNHVYHATDTKQWFISDGANWNTALIAGAWQNITLGSGVSAGSGYTPAARLVGDTVELCGTPTDFATTTAWGTIPAGLRPASTVTLVSIDATTVRNVSISPAGAITTSVASTNLALDGLSYRLS